MQSSFPLIGRDNSATIMGGKDRVPAEMLERDVAGGWRCSTGWLEISQ